MGREQRPKVPPRRPTRAEVLAAVGKTVPDVIASGLRVLFCGISPGLYSGATGHHFARPGNRFWPARHRSGFTPRQLSPWEEGELLEYGLGITNLVMRTTAKASELSDTELRAGGSELTARVHRYRPRWVAVLGVTAFRPAFGVLSCSGGRQPDPPRPSPVWGLANPRRAAAH